jgi:RNA polymerase sigma-70 factor, ECF subfamily
MPEPFGASSIDESDLALARRIGSGDQSAFEALMRRCNTRLFRVARAILKDGTEAEDVLQEAYLQAFRRISEFRGESQLATWLTRIVVNQSLMRARTLKRQGVVVPFADYGRAEAEGVDMADDRNEPASDALVRRELRGMLERKIDELPDSFRTVFVLREVEDLSVEETAACLGIPPATVRTRLFRAKSLLRTALDRDVDRATLEVFSFDGERCDRIVAGVLGRARGDGEGNDGRED